MKLLNIIKKKLLNYKFYYKKNELININFLNIKKNNKYDKYILIKKKQNTFKIKKVIQNIIIIKILYINSPLIEII